VVVETGATVSLNQQKLVEGLVITRPASVKVGQRRQFYRTMLATIQEPITGLIQEASDLEESPVPDECGSWVEGVVVDASAGGFGVRIEDSNYSKFKIFHNYFIKVVLPDSGREVVTLCELRQARSILDGQATKLGFLLLPWPSQAKLNWQIQPLLTFLTTMQRNRLAG